MFGQELIEIPIYRCSEKLHYDQCKKDIERGKSDFRKPIEDNIRHMLEDQYKTPWNYNEVIRWLVIYKQGIDLVGEEWIDNHERIFRNRKRNYKFNSSSAIRVRIFPEYSARQIYDALLAEIEEYSNQSKLKNRYVNISKLRNIGPFVDWRSIMDSL